MPILPALPTPIHRRNARLLRGPVIAVALLIALASSFALAAIAPAAPPSSPPATIVPGAAADPAATSPATCPGTRAGTTLDPRAGIGLDLDTDGDGLSDFQERHKYLTDPFRSDSDGDGIPDGDWDERREYAYTVRTIVRVVKPVDVEAASDDYQDARLLAEHDTDYGGWAELEVVHYPLGTAGEGIGADAGWRERARGLRPWVESTPTSCFDRSMRRGIEDGLEARGTDPDVADDRTLAVETARLLLDRAEFQDGFTTFLADYRRGRPVVPAELRDHVRQKERELGVRIEDQWERELLATGMFEHRVRGSCTSSAIYLCGGLRALGLPTRIVLAIPLVDASDPEQVALVERGIRHHHVRATVLEGLRAVSGAWASHTFNEVFVDGRWRRLNYARLGQPILDEDLFGLHTHVLTLRDWSDARMGRSVGLRQALGLRDEVFRTANPYATVEVSDLFGEHARVENPSPEELDLARRPAPIRCITIESACWLASPRRPAYLDVSGVDPETDRLHVVLSARTSDLAVDGDALGAFWRAVPRGFHLIPERGDAVSVEAVRGFWWGEAYGLPYLHFLLRLDPHVRDRLDAGTPYALAPAPSDQDAPRFEVAEGVVLLTPE